MEIEDQLLSSYRYDLPVELIAQRPSDNSRLMVYDKKTNELFHSHFKNIADFLPDNCLLVFNRSKVFPSRLIGQKRSGGRVEILLLSLFKTNNSFEALIKTTSKKKIGDQFYFEDGLESEIVNIGSDGTFFLKFNREDLASYLETYAKIPIPPYIRNGESDDLDKKDYQTSFSDEVGSVAAPTAGLHFKESLFQDLKNRNIDIAFVTLHVGIGTFRPVKTENILDHQMHPESFIIDRENDLIIQKARSDKKKIIAVGTTSLRVLESVFNDEYRVGEVRKTSIFIHPGKPVESVDGLITNFHLPESSLLMLVSSLIGRKKTLELYEIAVRERYRFFSYGDGMLLLK